jgi:selenocysteine-specific elongation factor
VHRASEHSAGAPFVIGTAGHVDHGKSTLVRAMTGIDPDRLAEEKAREMTIDLGFAWLDLPSGRRMSIVDVPGHERFIKNMLAGIGGIDAVMLIIAADEGPMPQTREHLSIIDLLGIDRGVVVLTKADLVDEEWLALVTEDVSNLTAGTGLENAPIVAVSAQSGVGLDRLIALIDHQAELAERAHLVAPPRLPIDRVFSMSGFGTIVTGTLSGSELTVGQEVTVMPSRQKTRVRGLQVHGSSTQVAPPRSRVAVNVTQLAVSDLRRGDVLTIDGALKPSRRLDLSLHLLETSPHAIEQNDQVDIFIGAAEAPAWLTLLDRERIEPGETAFVQARLWQDLAVRKGDRFIVRRPSPSMTIGGGFVVDPVPSRHKRFQPQVVESLQTMASGTPEELVLRSIDAQPRTLHELRAEALSGLDLAVVDETVSTLSEAGQIVVLESTTRVPPSVGDALISKAGWNHLSSQLITRLAAFHAEFPLRKGMPSESLRQQLGLSTRSYDAVIATAEREGLLSIEGPNLRRPDFAIQLPEAERRRVEPWLAALEEARFTPPGPEQFDLRSETVQALIESGQVVRAGEGVFFLPSVYEEIERAVLQIIESEGSVTLADVRDHFGTSRKYAQAVLESFDQRQVTRRIGDKRIRHSSRRQQPEGVSG